MLDLTKFITAFTGFVNWVKTALNGKQSKVLVGAAAPDNTVGNDGDVFLVIGS